MQLKCSYSGWSFPIGVLVFGRRLEEYFLKSVTEIVLLGRLPNSGKTFEFYSQNAPGKTRVDDSAYVRFRFKPRIDVWTPYYALLWLFVPCLGLRQGCSRAIFSRN